MSGGFDPAHFVSDLRSVPEALQGRSASTHQGDHQRSVSVSQDSFPATEINWFLTNCYNLAVKAVLIWPASAVIRLFETVIQVRVLIFPVPVVNLTSYTDHKSPDSIGNGIKE